MATTYLWSDYPAGGSIVGFDPDADVLRFDDTAIGAGVGASPSQQFDFFAGPGPTSYFSFAGVDVDVDLDARQFTQTNVTFASGSFFIFGDNTTATAGDDAGDTITGGAKGDWLVGGGGADHVSGGGGNDMLVVTGSGSLGDGAYGNDTLDGGSGVDRVFYDGADLAINANLATGVATGGRGGANTLKLISIEQVTSGDGNDTLNGSGTGNRLDGQDGNDRITGQGGNDSLLGGGGADSLIGGDGNDTFDGGDGNDTIWGNAGNDSIDGGDGDDSMLGGAGNDTYSVIEAGDKVVEKANEGIDTIITDSAITMAANVENLVWLNHGNSGVCQGNGQDNVMSASGGAGTLTMNGGGGRDTVSYAGQSVTVTVDLQAGTATFIASLQHMENATGGNLDDTLTGNAVANVLDGSAGADTMAGGYGNDTYYVDSAGDLVVEADNNVTLVLPGGDGAGHAGTPGITDTIIAAINFSLDSVSFVENLTLAGTAVNATGNALANRLTGNSRDNVLSGGGGNDTLDGGSGNDTLEGGADADVLKGGAGNDVLAWGAIDASFDGGTGSIDTLALKSGSLNLRHQDDGKIINIEQIDLRGAGNNTLTLATADVLAISSSTDTLRVLGDVGDKINAAGFVDTGVNVGALDKYTKGGAVLLVDHDLTVVT